MPYHDSITPPWLRRLVRAALSGIYLCLLLAGIASTIAPPTSMNESTSDKVRLLWGLYLIVGAALGLIGTVVRRPGWEWVGTGLLGAGWGVYAGVLLIRQWNIPGLATNGTVVAWGLFALVASLICRNGVLWSVGTRWKKAGA